MTVIWRRKITCGLLTVPEGRLLSKKKETSANKAQYSKSWERNVFELVVKMVAVIRICSQVFPVVYLHHGVEGFMKTSQPIKEY